RQFRVRRRDHRPARGHADQHGALQTRLRSPGEIREGRGRRDRRRRAARGAQVPGARPDGRNPCRPRHENHSCSGDPDARGRMIRLLAILLLAAPLAAAHESNFGRVILANCDLVVQGVASATRVEMKASVRVELAIESVLYGEQKQTDIVVFYNDPALLKKGEAVRGLFALKKLAEGGFNIVGKPVLTPAGDVEEAD